MSNTYNTPALAVLLSILSTRVEKREGKIRIKLSLIYTHSISRRLLEDDHAQISPWTHFSVRRSGTGSG